MRNVDLIQLKLLGDSLGIFFSINDNLNLKFLSFSIKKFH